MTHLTKNQLNKISNTECDLDSLVNYQVDQKLTK